MSDDVPEQYRPRLCHVVKWKDFQGYGFNLHAEKGKAGQFIGKVDENSPAEAAGLREGDRIVEVNGINIGNENHQQVVTRIKSGGDETRLLVVDSEADNWYKENKKIIRGDLPEVRFISAKRDIDDEPADGEDDNDEHIEQHRESHPEPDRVEETIVSHVPPVHNGNSISEDDSYRPRLCHLKIWPHFQGYGFNLHAEKDKPGQYIGLVDDNSPASTAGLRVHDRIIEVNGVNIEQEKHTEVIARIKAIPGETRLLVVDKETDNYYKDRGVTVTSSMPQTEYIATPDAADLPEQTEENEAETAKINTEAVHVSDEDEVKETQEKEGEEDSQEKEEDKNEEEDKSEQIEEEVKNAEQYVDVASSSEAEKVDENTEGIYELACTNLAAVGAH